MKLLLIGPSFEVPGGVANYCKLMLESLTLSTTYQTVGRRKGERGLLPGIRRFISDCRTFTSNLREFKPDVIQFNPSLNFQALLREILLLQLSRHSPARKVMFVHGWNPRVASILERPLIKYFAVRAFRSVSCFVVLSSEHRDALARIGVQAPIYVETVAVADDVGRDDSLVPRRSGIRLLFLSRVERAKGVRIVIETQKLLLERGCVSELAIAGDGPDLAAARQLVADEAIVAVSFLGYVDGAAKHEALSKATIFLFPTQYGEGLPTCVLEAMAYGLPVITTPVGGIRDFFEHGKMGFLAADVEPSTLADYVMEIDRDAPRRSEIGAYNEAYAKQRFNASAVSVRLRAIYQAGRSNV